MNTIAPRATGAWIQHPHWVSKSRAQRRRLQRHAGRQVKGGRRRSETYRHIAGLHERSERHRSDDLHTQSKRLVEEDDLMAIEDLTLAFMNRNRHRASSSHDAGLGIFRRMLEDKAESAGIPVMVVTPANAGQSCSGCGRIVPKDVSVRIYEDVNASRTLLTFAFHVPPGRSGQPAT